MFVTLVTFMIKDPKTPTFFSRGPVSIFHRDRDRFFIEKSPYEKREIIINFFEFFYF